MFGKNYDKDIEELYKKINEIVRTQNKNQEELLKMIKDNLDLINTFENSLLEIAKVQKLHKEAIMLLSKR